MLSMSRQILLYSMLDHTKTILRNTCNRLLFNKLIIYQILVSCACMHVCVFSNKISSGSEGKQGRPHKLVVASGTQVQGYRTKAVVSQLLSCCAVVFRKVSEGSAQFVAEDGRSSQMVAYIRLQAVLYNCAEVAVALA